MLRWRPSFSWLRRRKSRDILFVCSSEIDEIWIRTTAVACRRNGFDVEVAICGEAGANGETLRAFYDSHDLPFSENLPISQAADIACRIAVTASSGLDRTIFPTDARYLVHMPHSLASLHLIYPPDAFDGYDVLFAAGPHHEREFEAISARRGLPGRRSFKAGYGKMDILREAAARHRPGSSGMGTSHILLAPSWGPDNLLDRMGPELVEKLAAAGHRVTIRPHPLFFLEAASVLDALNAVIGRFDNCSMESPFSGDRAIMEADLLIGDYSGTSFEFAALRRKPVLSVDVGLKVVNSDWRSLGLDPIEIALRDSIGAVAPADANAILQTVEPLCARADTQEATIAEFLFNADAECSEAAVGALGELYDA